MSTEAVKLEAFFQENSHNPKYTDEKKQELRKFCELEFIEVITYSQDPCNGRFAGKMDLRMDSGAIRDWLYPEEVNA